MVELLELQKTKMPKPVFGCACEDCAAEVSYPPDMLFWCEGEEPGFYCQQCINTECIEEVKATPATTLEDIQKKVG